MASVAYGSEGKISSMSAKNIIAIKTQNSTSLTRCKGQLAFVSPRERLSLAAEGREEVHLQDLQALLCDHVMATDKSAKKFGQNCEQLVQMLLEAGTKNEIDPNALLDMTTKLNKLFLGRSAELRRTVELLHRITQPALPSVKIIAGRNDQVNVGFQQVNTKNPMNLGDRNQK